MLRPDVTGAMGGLWSTAQPSLAQGAGGGAAFGAVFRQMHNEVQQVIENGWPAGGAPALSLEGQVRRDSLQTTAAAPSAGAPSAGAPSAGAPSAGAPSASATSASQQEFLASIAPWARDAGQRLGVSPDIVSAHAALESGWGQRLLRDAAGQDTHNLFGLKAQSGFSGGRTEALTTEYEDGVAVKKTEGFRSYPDYASAFQDYTRLLQDNPRYRDALQAGNNAGAFAQALARGGYATDPHYAAKLTRLATQIQSLD